MDDITKTWSEDPEFTALPRDRKQRILSNYFDTELADDEFRGLDSERQTKIKDNFLSSVIKEEEAPTFASRVEKALKTLPLTVDPLALVRKEEALKRREPILPGGIREPEILEEALPAVRRPAPKVLPSEEIGVLEAARRGVTHGIVGVAESVGTGLEYAGVRTGIELLKRVGKETRDYWEKKAKPLEAPAELQGSILNDPGIMTKGSWWAYNLADMAPSFVSMMIPGVAAAKYLKIAGTTLPLTEKVVERLVKFGSMTAAGITAGGMEGTSTYQEILDRGGSEQDAAAGMEAMTLAAGALNSIGFGKITGALGDKKASAIMRFLKNGSWEGLTEYLEEPTEVLIKLGILPEAAFTKEEAIEQLKAGVNVIPIAGVMGGGTSMIFAEPSKKKENLKKTVLDGITETYEAGTQNADQIVGSIIRGYKNQLFDDVTLDELSTKYPELKTGIDSARETVRADVIKDTLTEAIDTGFITGEFKGETFTPDTAIDFIRNGLVNDIFATEDVDGFKTKYPQLRSGLNELLAVQVGAGIAVPTIEPPVMARPVSRKEEEYADEDLEAIYVKAKERARTEPLTLHELQERFKERKKREATEKEKEEVRRIFEKAKVIEREKIPVLPPGQQFELVEPAPEVRLRPSPEKIEGPVYPEGVEYVAGKPAPEKLPVEYKPILTKKGTPWVNERSAVTALKTQRRLKDIGVTEKTHKIVPVKGGFQIVKKTDTELLQVFKKVKPEKVKGKTLLSWVKAMGSVQDKTLPGEVRALTVKEAGVVGLTTSAPGKGLAFDEMASAAVEEGWLPENLEDESGAFMELLEKDIYGIKEKRPEVRARRLADERVELEREERREEFERAEIEELEHYAVRPDEEARTDLNQWQRESVEEIRRRTDEATARETEEGVKSEVESEDADMEGFKKDEGFTEFVEAWDEKELLDKESLAELEAWRVEREVEPKEKPKAVPLAKIKLTKDTSYDDLLSWIDRGAEKYGGKNKFYASEEYRKSYPIVAKITEKHEQAYRIEAEKALSEAGVVAGDRVETVGVSLAGMEVPIQGNVYLGKKGIPKVKTDEGKIVKWHKGWRKIEKKVKPEPEIAEPIAALLSSKKKAGVNYEMEVTVEETGETVTVTKDAAVALRETKEELSKWEKLLECLT